MSDKKERIAKVMAHAGLCSRRDAEQWILDGRVSVNGEVLDSPAFTVGPEDEIVVDGEVLPGKQVTRLFLYYKPAGLVTTNKDEYDRDTIFDHLPQGLPRVVSVGRLDMNTEGLLLLTTDGELSRYLELPSTGWRRRYRVRAYGAFAERDLQRLEKGITVEGIHYGPIEISVDSQRGDNTWFTLVLTEGKNREIRKVMEAVGLRVNRLIRVAYGPFQLGQLREGDVEEVTGKVMRDQLAGFFKDKPRPKTDRARNG